MNLELNTFVVADPDKCISCRSCEVACATVHRDKNSGFTVGCMESPIDPRLFLTKEKKISMPIQCRHCADSPCVNACPTNAISKEDEGIIINSNACIGCKTCSLVCTVGAINLLTKHGNDNIKALFEPRTKYTAHKCDLCKDKSETPACVKACPKDALNIVQTESIGKNLNKKAALALIELREEEC